MSLVELSGQWWVQLGTLVLIGLVVLAVHMLLRRRADRHARKAPAKAADALDNTIETLIRLVSADEQDESMTLDERNVMIAMLVRELHARNRRRPVEQQYEKTHPIRPERPTSDD